MATISAVGSLVSNAGARTMAVTPTTVGNAILLVCDTSNATISGTIFVSAVSGGGCSTWTQIAGPFKETADSFDEDNLWLGIVTSTGSSTITVTTSATLSGSGTGTFLAAQEFTAGGGASTIWSSDGSGGTLNNGTSSTTVTYPTLTPSGSQRLYFGFGYCTSTGLATGQTAGYTAELDNASNIVLFNPNVSSVQSPIGKQTSSGKSSSIAALVTATVPSARRAALYNLSVPLKRSSLF